MSNNDGSNLAQQNALELKSGYRLEICDQDKKQTLSLKAPDGQLSLKINLTPAGPEVELNSVSLHINAQKDLTLGCENFQIKARKDLKLSSGGDLVQSAQGNIATYAKGNIETEGFEQCLTATTGDFVVTANDDVMLDGEKIRLNSPKTPSDYREKENAARALIEQMVGKLPEQKAEGK